MITQHSHSRLGHQSVIVVKRLHELKSSVRASAPILLLKGKRGVYMYQWMKAQ